MPNTKNTISIYGITDRYYSEFPAYVHDHNLCFVQNGNLLNYLHLERLTRRKYDNTLSQHIEDILFSNNFQNKTYIDTTFLFVNTFVGSSFISQKGRIRFDCFNHSKDLLAPVKGYCYIQESQWNGYEVSAYSITHEIAHVFSVVPFAGGLRENSLLVSFDGGSSTGNFAAFHYKNGQLFQLESHWELSQLSKFYNDNGLTFGIINANPGEHCSVPGKFMGYASYGKSDPRILYWLQENDFFKDSWGDRADFIGKAKQDFHWRGSLINNNDEFLFDVAACMQDFFKISILEKLKQLVEKTRANYLYYAGGCALNIVANADLVKNNWFRDVFISPCCNDSGLSIGAASYFAYLNNYELTIDSPYLNDWNCNKNYNFTKEDIIQTAETIKKGKVIGICNGNGEAGPRALGNRSIIALANSKALSEKISMNIKGREWYRPIAPIMLEKNAMIFTGLEQIHHLSKYMLLDFPILFEYHNELQGVVHSNGTSRIQTIDSKKENPFMYTLLSYLDEVEGIRALINTSFNAKGQPIVQTIEDAASSAKKMGLDGIIINGKLKNIA